MLHMCKLLALTNGTNKLPTLLSGTDAQDEEKVKAYKETYVKWKQCNNEAFSQIMLNMEDGVMADEEKGMQLLSFLYQQLRSTKIKEEEDLMNGFNKIKSTISKIKMLGKTINNFLLVQIIMNVLPLSYAIVSTVIQMSMQQGVIMSDIVCKAALAKEEHCHKGGGITVMFAQLSKSKPMQKKLSGNNSKGKKKDQGTVCGNCGKARHTKQECWSKGGGAKGSGPKQKQTNSKPKDKSNKSMWKNNSAKVAVTNKTSNSTPLKIYALAASDIPSNHDNFWLLNSGVMTHRP
ncbi:hypothetical protein OPQ81_000521 [Rhizoctonia solani]|nr:hypothetical protein OPQ81_000521 [Rhizoctonia solani]